MRATRVAAAYGSPLRGNERRVWLPQTENCLAPEPPRGLHALHVVAGEVGPDQRVAHELLHRLVHDAASGAVNLQVELGYLMDDVAREVHGEAGAVRVELLVVLPGDPHHERAQRLGEHVHLVELELNDLLLEQDLAALLRAAGVPHRLVTGLEADTERV